MQAASTLRADVAHRTQLLTVFLQTRKNETARSQIFIAQLQYSKVIVQPRPEFQIPATLPFLDFMATFNLTYNIFTITSFILTQ